MAGLLEGKKGAIAIALAVGAIGAYLYFTRKTGAAAAGAGVKASAGAAKAKPAAASTASKPPAPVGKGEKVSASTYVKITKRKTGMTYAKATGTLGGLLTFTSPIKGLFTRNVLVEKGVAYAEIKKA